MQTIRKNVKCLLLVTGYVVLLFFIAVVGLLLLSNWLGVGTIIFVAKYHATIAWVGLGIFGCLLGYKLYRFMKNAKDPWQTIKRNVRENSISLLSIPIILYVGIASYVSVFSADYVRCDYYNERLSGGVKEYEGQKFRVNLCGTGGDSMQRNDSIRLEVFNEKGDLVAIRHFVVDWDTSFDRRVQYHSDHITYFDDSDEDDYKKTISMPPTFLDWIRARVPLLD